MSSRPSLRPSARRYRTRTRYSSARGRAASSTISGIERLLGEKETVVEKESDPERVVYGLYYVHYMSAGSVYVGAGSRSPILVRYESIKEYSDRDLRGGDGFVSSKGS